MPCRHELSTWITLHLERVFLGWDMELRDRIYTGLTTVNRSPSLA